ncbi:hypothetical protein EYC80_006016 [Monilinia laxa]|uniref:Uncharacterized protein n=1 Tax=Monilinia laxa TaxID=61186 RepID=A0A5N6KG28_MONLA|nr:hypothetical protein EYC80_006016 [Monilinia laxa]
MMSSDVRTIGRGAEKVPYFTPAQYPPSGTAVKPQPKDKRIPKLFQPLKIRGCAAKLGPNGMDLWKEEQVESLKEIVDFTHSQSQFIGIQLFHSGRKGSIVAP